MDPDFAYEIIFNYVQFKQGSMLDLHEAMSDLSSWIRKGGFEPKSFNQNVIKQAQDILNNEELTLD